MPSCKNYIVIKRFYYSPCEKTIKLSLLTACDLVSAHRL